MGWGRLGYGEDKDGVHTSFMCQARAGQTNHENCEIKKCCLPS